VQIKFQLHSKHLIKITWRLYRIT